MPSAHQPNRLFTAQPLGHHVIMEMLREKVQTSSISQDDRGSKDGPALGDILMRQQLFATSFFGELRMVFEEDGMVFGLGEGTVLRRIDLVSGKDYKVGLRRAAKEGEVLLNVLRSAGQEINYKVEGLAGFRLLERPFLYCIGQFTWLIMVSMQCNNSIGDWSLPTGDNGDLMSCLYGATRQIPGQETAAA